MPNTTAAGNFSLPSDAVEAFAEAWAHAKVTGRRDQAAWASLPSAVQVSVGLRAGQCQDLDRCVGVVGAAAAGHERGHKHKHKHKRQAPAEACLCYAI